MNTALSDFLNREPTLVARDLLGCSLFSKTSGAPNRVGGIICETEAYLAQGDNAAHNSRGLTIANKSLFSNAGAIYVHQLRHHILLDIVTEGPDLPGSVLIRALEPTEGIDLMMARRGITDIHALCRGPGNLCKALGIDRTFDGDNLSAPNARITLDIDRSVDRLFEISTTSRVGIVKNAAAPLRFLIAQSRFTTKYK